MEKFEAKIDQLVFEQSGKPRSFVRTFIIKPDPKLVDQIGTLFGLIEIESNHSAIPSLIDFIIQDVQDNYYNPSHIKPHQEFPPVGIHFESTLKKSNLALAAYLESEHISIDLKRVNILIAVTHREQLHFSFVGNVGAFLFYRVARDNHKIINIWENSRSLITDPDPLKLFSQIISGKTRQRDVLFVTTSNLLDYFSLERIKNILTYKLPSEGLLELKDLIKKTQSKENFGVLALELEKVPQEMTLDKKMRNFDYERAASSDSINTLVNTEKETEKLLTPSLLPEIKKYASSFKIGFNNYLKKAKNSTNTIYKKQRENLSQQTQELGQRAKNIKFSAPNIKTPKLSLPKISLPPRRSEMHPTLKKSVTFFKQLFVIIHAAIITFLRSAIWKKLSGYLKIAVKFSKAKIQRLSLRQQLILALAVVVMIFFTYNSVIGAIRSRNEAELTAIEDTINSAEQKKVDAESSLIYRDENLARQLLMEAQDLLSSVEATTDEQAQRIANLENQINQNLQQLRHMVTIENPVLLINFNNFDQNAQIAPFAEFIDNNIISQNTANQALYVGNSESKVIQAILSPETNIGTLKYSAFTDEGRILLLNEEQRLFTFTPGSQNVQPLNINISEGTEIKGITSFRNRLYTINSDGQVYRYNPSGSGFTAPTGWLNSESAFSPQGISLTVDGSIYVLNSNGEVKKYFNGEPQEYSLKTIDPPLGQPTKIWTNETSAYLYVIDPAEKRLVVINKADGTLKIQYTSPEFDNLKDFAVNPVQQRIYVLNGSSAYGFSAEHLQ